MRTQTDTYVTVIPTHKGFSAVVMVCTNEEEETYAVSPSTRIHNRDSREEAVQDARDLAYKLRVELR